MPEKMRIEELLQKVTTIAELASTTIIPEKDPEWTEADTKELMDEFNGMKQALNNYANAYNNELKTLNIIKAALS